VVSWIGVLVELVISQNVHDRHAGKLGASPRDGFRSRVDVSGKDNEVHRWRLKVKGPVFEMEIAANEETHRALMVDLGGRFSSEDRLTDTR